MICPRCSLENPDTMAFCGHCGAALPRPCSTCGAANPAEFQFCGLCGAPLTPGREGERLAGVGKADPPAGEPVLRRQVTLMFCDLADSTAMSASLDPEDYGDVIRAYREVCTKAITRSGGTITRYLGDGLLIAFGFPTAHEDDPQRAVTAALAVVAAIKGLELAGLPDFKTLTVRIGIHTGLVIAGDLKAGGTVETQALLGEAPNLTARIQQTAEPNAVIISAATHRRVSAFFNCRSLGLQHYKGIAQPVEVFEVTGATSVRDRTAGTGAFAVPILGRDREIGLLIDQWARLDEGHGQSVMLTGDPGIGKSRLIAELRRRLAGEGTDILLCHCSAYDVASSLRPIIDLIFAELRLGPEQTGRERSALLEAELRATGTADPMALEALGSLLDLPPDPKSAFTQLTPQRQRLELFEALIRWLAGRAERAKLLFVVEDLHWADNSTLAFIGQLLNRLPTMRMLAVFSARPEFQPTWPSRSRQWQIALDRLADVEVRTMIARLARGHLLREDTVEEILRKAEGTPLFVEELVKEVLAATRPMTGPSLPTPVPSTLRDLLMARIDRLANGRSILEIGSALGRSFSLGMLLAASGANGAALQRDVNELVRQEFFDQRGLPPAAAYSFRHVLIKDVVYESVLKSERQRIHRRIAEALSRQFPEIAEQQPEVIGAHWASAGEFAKAIEQWQRAGRRASERSANIEAVHHLSRSLELVANLPEPQRVPVELSLQLALGAQMIALKGNAAPEVEKAFGRAYELCGQVKEAPLLFRALRGLQTFHVVRGKLAAARTLGERLLEQADRSGDPDLLLQAHRPHGLCLLYLGQLNDARRHLEQAVALYDARRHAVQRFDYGSDPLVLALCNLGWAEWFLGRTGRGLDHCRQAVAQARALEHPHSEAFALALTASVHQARQEPADVITCTDSLLRISRHHGFVYWSGWAMVLRGWAVGRDPSTDAGSGDIDEGVNAYAATGAELMLPYFLALKAEVEIAKGRFDHADRDLTLALRYAEDNDIRFYEAELYRIRGEMTAAIGDRDEARKFLRKAIRVAEGQSAVSLALRATVSLAQLADVASDREEVLENLRRLVSAVETVQGNVDLARANGILAAAR